MLTKGAKRIMAAAFAMPGTDFVERYYIPFKETTNLTRYAKLSNECWPAVNYYGFLQNITGLSSGIAVGSGNTAATDDDYTLENAIPYYNLNGYVSILNISMKNDYPCVELLVSVSNVGSSAFTVSEIGYFMRVYSKTSPDASSGITATMLIDRSVLSTPVTIAAGETKEIKYTITGQWA